MPGKSDVILDKKKINRALTRIAHEILEQNPDARSLVIIGIITRGAHLARRIAAIIEELEGVEIPVGLMDIGLYRDDVHSKLDQPVVERTEILFDVVNRNVILVDDVLFTGRTVRARSRPRGARILESVATDGFARFASTFCSVARLTPAWTARTAWVRPSARRVSRTDWPTERIPSILGLIF